jgi:hypothetical protein
LRPKPCRDGFDCGQGDHLTGYLGETFGASLGGDEARGFDRNDIAGIVPAIGEPLQYAGVFGAKIAEHDVRTAHREASALFDAGDRIDA